MNYRIRRNVFETNSSAVHSITFSKEGLKPSKLKLNKEGYIEIKCMSYWDECDIYSSQYDKLHYIVNHIVATSDSEGRNGYINYNSYDDYRLGYIDKALKEYVPDCKGLYIINPECAEVNHQLSDSYDIDDIVNVWDKDSVINVIFNDNIMINLSRD